MSEKAKCVIAGRYPTAGVWEFCDGGFREVWRGEAGGRATGIEAARKVAMRMGFEDLHFCPVCGCHPTLECVERPHDPLFVAAAKELQQGSVYVNRERSKVEERLTDTADGRVH